MPRRRAASVLLAALVATALIVVPTSSSPGAGARGIRLASLGTTQPVTFNAVVGDAVFFSTAQALVATDDDTKIDVYRWADGALTLATAGAPALDVTFNAVVRDGAMVIGSRIDGGRLRVFRYTGFGEQPVNQTTGVADAFFKGSSPDGNAIAFETTENTLGDDDNNGSMDVFVDYFDPVTPGSPSQILMTPSTAEDAHFAGGSTNMHTIVYRTDEALSANDHNSTTDLYGEGDAFGNPGFTLLSDGVGAADSLNAVATNGSAIVFTSSDDNAAAGDTDGQPDIYWSMGLGGDLLSGGSVAATYAGSTPGLEAVYYSTTAQLDVADTDNAADVYVRDLSGLPALATGGSQDLDAHLDDVPITGRFVFDTLETLVAPDLDPAGRDLYTFDDAGDWVLLSGTGSGDVTFGAVTDVDAVYFTSPDRLTAADTDDAQDVYVNEGGTITLVSGGTANTPATFEGVNPDGGLAVFSTTEQLSAADLDATADLYTFGPVTIIPPDTTAPTGTATAKKQKNDGRIEVALTCGSAEACTATPSGTLTVPRVSRGQQKFSLKGKSVTVAAGNKATLKLKVPKKAKKSAARALKAGKKVKAKITVTIADAAGNTRTVSVTVKLKA